MKNTQYQKAGKNSKQIQIGEVNNNFFFITGNQLPIKPQSCLFDSVFIQYLNPEILNLYAVPKNQKYYTDCLNITKIAILLAENLLLPASYFSEVKLIHQYIVDISPAIQNGLVYYISPVADIKTYIEYKRPTYKREDIIHQRYEISDVHNSIKAIIWKPRSNSATKNISDMWRQSVSYEDDIWKEFIREYKDNKPFARISKLEQNIYSAPRRLEKLAIVHRHIKALLPKYNNPYIDNQIATKLSRDYLISYLSEYSSAILYEFPFGILDCDISIFSETNRLQKLSYNKVVNFLNSIGLSGILDLSVSDVVKIRLNEYERMAVVTSIIIFLYNGAVLKQFLEILRSKNNCRVYKTPRENVAKCIENIHIAINQLIINY